VLLAIVLSLPCAMLGYFWDDFFFLATAQTEPFAHLLPRAGDVFYRPLSQCFYFLFLRSLGAPGSLVAHLVNLGLAAVSVALFVRLASRLAGRRAGWLGGIAFATFAPLPALVAWASCAQDLFAIVLILLALSLRDQGRNGTALVASALALLCKETVLVLFPALVLWDGALGRKPARVARAGLAYGALLLAWAALHPGIRALVGHGLRSGATGYLGVGRPDRWGLYIARYVATLLNLPPTGWQTPWPSRLTLVWAVALALLGAGFWILRGRFARQSGDATGVDAGAAAPHGRLVLLGLLLLLPPIAVHVFFIRHWASYFAGLSDIGGAFLLGVLLARAPLAAAAAALAAYMTLGVWYRGAVIPGGLVMTEPNFVEASAAIRHVRAGFLALRPSLPRGSEVLLSLPGTGMVGIHQDLRAGQALRLWYDDPKLATLPTERHRGGFVAEFLFRVTPELEVYEIDPDRLTARSSGRPARLQEMTLAISNYARGVAASGDPARAARILERLADQDPEPYRSYDRRLSASVALWEGRAAEAGAILSRAGPLSRQESLDFLVKIFAEPTSSASLDSCAYRAFDVSPEDPEALRYLMKMFHILGYEEQAVVFARRVQAVDPGDEESAELIRSPAPRW
jgi:hypothetical protein